jgi:hypothetical protein
MTDTEDDDDIAPLMARQTPRRTQRMNIQAPYTASDNDFYGMIARMRDDLFVSLINTNLTNRADCLPYFYSI